MEPSNVPRVMVVATVPINIEQQNQQQNNEENHNTSSLMQSQPEYSDLFEKYDSENIPSSDFQKIMENFCYNYKNLCLTE